MNGRRLDYLVIGHVTRDKKPAGGFSIGGTAAYAARTARALVDAVGVITSAGAELDLSGVLPGIDVLRVPARTTTTFDNDYTPDGRRQIVEAVAEPLTSDAIPPSWRDAGVVHLGPVVGECDPALADLFPGAFLGITPQGWMRSWDATGRVRPGPWADAEALLSRADAVVISEEDVRGEENLIPRWSACSRLLVVTRGSAGCTLSTSGTMRDLPAPPAVEMDPTGAGDVFAAVFFLLLRRGQAPVAAARMANCVAAVSVSRQGLDGLPTSEEIAHCWDLA